MDELAALVEQVPDEILDYIEDLETRVEKAEGLLAEFETPEPDSIEKALSELPPTMAEFVKSQSDRLAEAEKALEAERVNKADGTWITKSRSFDGLVDSPEDFGPKLRKVADVDPELAESIVSALEAANARLAKSALFGELGHNLVTPGSADEKADHIAKAMVDADPTLSKEVALAKVWETNPDLYDQHVAEHRAAARQ